MVAATDYLEFLKQILSQFRFAHQNSSMDYPGTTTRPLKREASDPSNNLSDLHETPYTEHTMDCQSGAAKCQCRMFCVTS
jgi:hypothetical protein